MFGLTIGGIFYLALIFGPFIIMNIKKRRQVGNLWSGPLTAKLQIADKELSCKHCGETEFQKREGILATSWLSLFHLSCWNQSASCYTCKRCGRVEWFVCPKEEKLEFKRGE